jgi:hypothetical protein
MHITVRETREKKKLSRDPNIRTRVKFVVTMSVEHPESVSLTSVGNAAKVALRNALYREDEGVNEAHNGWNGVEPFSLHPLNKNEDVCVSFDEVEHEYLCR